MRIAEPEFAAMQRRHRRRQAEAEAGTGQRPARLQPHEPLDRMLAVAFGNAGPMIGDAEQHVVALAPRLDQDLPGAHGGRAASSGCTAGDGLPYLIAFSTRLASAWLISSRLPCSGAVAALTRKVMPSSSASGS